MRTAWLAIAIAACTPEIVSGSYLCGPNASCPEGHACSGENHTCVLPGQVMPFACEPQLETEPDDTSDDAYVINKFDCGSPPFSVESCMDSTDTSDWIKFAAPATCAAAATVTISFPVAFQRLALELRDLDRDVVAATDSTCATSGQSGMEQRCLSATLIPGNTYGVQVHPAGDGDCGGSCAYNSYKLSVQLAPPR